jgi:hypothetical protein
MSRLRTGIVIAAIGLVTSLTVPPLGATAPAKAVKPQVTLLGPTVKGKAKVVRYWGCSDHLVDPNQLGNNQRAVTASYDFTVRSVPYHLRVDFEDNKSGKYPFVWPPSLHYAHVGRAGVGLWLDGGVEIGHRTTWWSTPKLHGSATLNMRTRSGTFEGTLGGTNNGPNERIRGTFSGCTATGRP